MSAANMVLGSSRAGVRVGASRPSTTCPLQPHARQQQRRGARLLARYQPGPFDKWFSSLVSKPQQSAGTDEEPMMGNATHEQQQMQQEVQAPAVQVAPAAVHAKAPPPKMRDYLEARQVSIYQLLDSEDMKFDIPVYQRPYSWGTKQVFEMLQDFLSAYSAKQEYFLGAIVTVRGSDNPTSAFQVIDGQQRLTSLFIMLACLHNWAKQQGNDVLQQRVWRMLHMEADPLDSSSSSRYRLRLREADDDFFRANVMEAFLPTQFEFTGTARLQQDDAHTSHTTHTSAHTNGTHSPPTNTDTDADSGSGSMYSSGVASFDSSATSSLGSAAAAAAAPSPLEAEVHWRLYQNAEFLRAHMQALVTNQGLNLQDFMFHVLRNCYVVVMTARDEASSFRIFSTLNSRGVDLSEVDKLKADLLQVLEPSERAEYGAQWAEMENLLGRQQFHRVFSYMKDLASVLESQLSNQTVLEYFTRDLSRHSASQVIRVALDYAKILLQMRQARWAGPAAAPVQPAAAAAAPPALAAEGVEAVEGVAAVAVGDSGVGGEGDLEEGVYMDGVGSVTARVHGFDGGSVGSEEVSTTPSTGHAGHQHAPAAADGDEEAVGAESVGSVERSVEEERGADVATLLAALGQQSRHLNVLQEEDWVPATLEFMLQVEDPALRLRFLHSVETLTMFLGLCGDAALRANRWRRVTLALLRRPLDPQAVLQAVALTAEDKATFLSRLDSKDLAATVDERTLTHLLLRAEYADDVAGTAASTSAQQGQQQQQQQRFTVDQVRLHRMLPQQPPDGSAWRRHKLFLPVPAATPSTPSASHDPQQQQQQQEAEAGTWQECKYWFEVQRLSWQGKLGNLVLLPVRATGASAVASADYEKKAEFIRQCGAEELLPRFSGAVSSPNGRYARQRFSPDECRQRHADVIAALTTLYELA